MIIYYGSPTHLLTVVIALSAVAGVYFLLKNRPKEIRRGVIFFLSLVNLAQHLFKPFVWPHLAGTGFTYLETAYNVCALFIILTPFALIIQKNTFSMFISGVGMAAGILPILFPQWFVGQSVFQWEFLRGYFCHVLLLTTSVLPLLFQEVTLRARCAPLMGLYFFLALFTVFADNIVCIQAGISPKGDETLWECLYRLNPFWMMHPPENFPLVTAILKAFSIGIPTETYAYPPVIWYFVPLFLLVSVLFYLAGKISERSFRRRKNSVYLIDISPESIYNTNVIEYYD